MRWWAENRWVNISCMPRVLSLDQFYCPLHNDKDQNSIAARPIRSPTKHWSWAHGRWCLYRTVKSNCVGTHALRVMYVDYWVMTSGLWRASVAQPAAVHFTSPFKAWRMEGLSVGERSKIMQNHFLLVKAREMYMSLQKCESISNSECCKL